ncbi:MAG: histidine kinase dimerization/phospho-acceptor domain-containing protein [Rhodocyclaceae bacterium]|nr:histidine kinase dimerization/phospho-acceptor domain-containing protein [Rhodocyclaceae bacterium]
MLSFGAHGGVPADAFWRSLHYFSLYRLIIAAVFLAAFILTGGAINLGSEAPVLFRWTSHLYLLLAFGFLFILRRFHWAFNLQLTIQVACDVLALTLMMHASGGAKSGIAVMLVVVLAGAGLVGQGRMTLFYAALATLAVLFEQSFRFLHLDASPEDFVRIGLTSIGFFATAIIARLLARRIVANEDLARRRGIELADQLRINQQVIRDMQDGVLVVDKEGHVQQHNPQAESLLDVRPPESPDLATFSVSLAEHFARTRFLEEETGKTVRVPGSGRLLRARFLPPGEGGNTLIYIEDLGRVQAQAQQIKLAALGRLTANIAHEIRNPLAAISHAAELLPEEQCADRQERLIHIIGDNARRLNRLVSEVLELGRRDKARPEPVFLSGFLRQFLDEYAIHDPTVRERVALIADAEAIFCFDRAHLHRVVENLLTNALRHAGAVRLEAGWAPSANRAELHIVDDGPGIPEAARGQIFEPFFTTHGSGTGLGLYIARELCDANAARLELLDSAAGAHFRITGRGGECPSNPSGGVEST